ncbi:MAG: energy transducer TonB [Acidobacteriales bacterium]|jgi:protein TonB|nr:energy transducer TonB [Terriglobales bacterium]
MSVIMEGNLITRIQPKYPVIARQIGLQGTVIVKAIISREGNIEKAVPVSGPPLLAPAAIQAVEQWKYRPYYLNGEPIEVETQITVNFVLAR